MSIDTSTYRKVASSRLSWLVAHSRIFRLFMKGKFDGQKSSTLNSRPVYTARNFTVHIFSMQSKTELQFAVAKNIPIEHNTILFINQHS